MMKFKPYLLLSLMVITSITINAQTKNEQEIRIEKEDFPKKALNLLEHLPENIKRIKYYKETDQDKTSFEAKLKLKRKKYSIEFDETGNLEDIEITVKSKNIDKVVLKTIETFFKSEYKKYGLLKIQNQYKKQASIDAISTLQKAIENSQEFEINLEIIAQVQTKNSKKQVMEFTFNHLGSLLESRIVEPSSYEHVLY